MRHLVFTNTVVSRPDTEPSTSLPPGRTSPDLGDLVSSQDEFDENVGQQSVVVVDWMARWCRKCIYLKPKLTKMLKEEFPGIPVVFIDVNAVPGTLVYDQGIRKMPTITIYKDGQKVREHIAAEGGLKAVTAIREMIKEYVDKEGGEGA
ncbi:hypothetical protein WJX73_004704 [Symbiochloris irregularis]|uniref:Thioredoxin domain-containing protein n=1 Tax=Symbiochloris irregularis TaxID=706552 RepID=A0AAW1NL72_9CHLO